MMYTGGEEGWCTREEREEGGYTKRREGRVSHHTASSTKECIPGYIHPPTTVPGLYPAHTLSLQVWYSMVPGTPSGVERLLGSSRRNNLGRGREGSLCLMVCERRGRLCAEVSQMFNTLMPDDQITVG